MIVRPCGVLARGGELLVMRYRYGGRERLNLPGGKPEGKEGLIPCLVREFAEELGLEVVVGPLLWVAETVAGGRHVLHLVFQVTGEGEPRLNPAHTTALGVAWLAPAGLGAASLYPALGTELSRWLATGGEGQGRFLGEVEQPWE